MNVLEALWGLIVFLLTCVLLFALIVIPFILAWYVSTILLVKGVLWWTVYLFVLIVSTAMLRWSMNVILDIRKED